ncbi:uncharacterized protein LOC101733085 [Xenopus tropicalis]|uniref:Uncharacterized protein LOC101733085 n=1 Tax=Xenopus tropicalis TaxID=8364 RepID=A0A8J0R3J9_XENTR|nr:uncharacterized protein LOC101733085 [Xenopus tropicalis]XP_004913882.2 uncharacterized protein LOC101733085 [Xenopus tropicalis]
MPSCIVQNCGNTSHKASEKGLKLHPFPTTLERIKLWLRVIPQRFEDLDSFAQQILDAKKTKPYRVCSQHFTKECYVYMSGKPFLSQNAVPSVFNSARSPPAKRFCMDPAHVGLKEKPACVDVSTRTDIYNFGKDRGTQFDRYYGVKSRKVATEPKSFTRDVATFTDPRIQTAEPQISSWEKKLKVITPRPSVSTVDKGSQCPKYDFCRNQSAHFNVGPSYKDLMGMSEGRTYTVMGNKDKNQRNEKILNLTMEIIYLLTGEDFMVMKRSPNGFPERCSDCMSEGPCRRHTPTVSHSFHSVTNEKLVLELISNIIQLLTGEEWENLKDFNKALYREGIKEEEEPQQLRPLSCRYEDMRNNSVHLQATVRTNPVTNRRGTKRAASAPLQPPAAVVIKEEPTEWDVGDYSHCSAADTLPGVTGTHTAALGCNQNINTTTIKEEAASWKEENQSDCSINPFAEQGTDTPTLIMGCTVSTMTIKEEPDSWEGESQSDCSINPLTEQIQGTDTPTLIMGCTVSTMTIKEEPDSWEGESQSDCSINPYTEQGTDTPLIMGCTVSTMTIKEEPDSWEGESQSDCSINPYTEQGTDAPTSITGSRHDYIANTIKREAALYEGGNHSDYSNNPCREQIQGTGEPSFRTGFILKNS